ncbi:phosphoglycolate phosphatase [Lysobacter sp. KIS68-7]|uniref:phosphoglycolate phosphatase n=1 Tax=Lysobacter sp. KIS68-7 TaxID=2904252 RepID=UPI001E4AE303|nr:phosphoglycolate phosphatase [Lysobacter sp. KIS68-7]UHQ18485.1 phosphoglycolate phosphatase [Lysobacter sp. KIS68-7]
MTAARKERGFPCVVLFDLDGTLLDSAPDMLATVDAMRAARGRGPMAMETLRPVVSKGARAMTAAAFPDIPAEERNQWIPEFLEIYERELGKHGTLFDGIDAMLHALEAAGSAWGIVTNKPEYLARQLMPMLGWETRCAILIGGDTLAERKPHPLPLLHAAQVLGVTPDDCVYVGDDERDIMAARAAEMRSVVALWGYRLHEDDPMAWQGDVLVETPHALCDAHAWPER